MRGLKRRVDKGLLEGGWIKRLIMGFLLASVYIIEVSCSIARLYCVGGRGTLK